MTPEQREELKRLVRPYVITALRYPSSHAPDNHFDFPLSEEFEGVFPYTLITPHGYYPLYRDPEMLEEKFEHFGCELRIQAPLITQAAKLLYFACLETVSIPPPPGIPATRAHAVALNLPDGIPTTEDYEEMNAHKSAQLVDVGSWDWRAELNEEQGRLEDDGVWRKDLRSTSARWDNDWQRWCYCWDPWSDRDELKGVVYTYGTLSGLWQGRAMVGSYFKLSIYLSTKFIRLQLPDIDGYFRLVQSQAFPNDFSASNPFLSVIPVYMNLREHHCINPEFPVGPGGSNDGFDEGLCNGWFPDQRLEESRDRGIVTCTDSSGNISRYETYSPTRRNSHHEDTCTTCLHRKADEEAALLRRIERRRRPEEQQRMVVAPQVQGIHEGEALRWTRLFPTQVNHDVNHDDPEPLAGPSNTAGNVVDEEAMDTAGSSSTPVESTDEVAQYHYEASNSLGGDVHDVIDTEMNAADGEGNAHLADNEHGGETMEYETIVPDQDAEYSDFIENHCTGIQDIIVTGEVKFDLITSDFFPLIVLHFVQTLHRHGQAWFHHRYYGRVRRYDGLIAIVRYEVHHPGQNVWIFRGYVTGDKNLVGSWRAWSNDVTVIPLEGPFVMSKVPTTQNPQ